MPSNDISNHLSNDPSNYTVQINNIEMRKAHANEDLGLSFFTLDRDNEKLVFVNKISSGSAAHRNGQIYEGDLILKINEVNINSISTAFRMISDNKLSCFTIQVARPVLKMAAMVEIDKRFQIGNGRQSTLNSALVINKRDDIPYSTWDSREKDSGLDIMNSFSDDSFSSGDYTRSETKFPNDSGVIRDNQNNIYHDGSIDSSNYQIPHSLSSYRNKEGVNNIAKTLSVMHLVDHPSPNSRLRNAMNSPKGLNISSSRLNDLNMQPSSQHFNVVDKSSICSSITSEEDLEIQAYEITPFMNSGISITNSCFPKPDSQYNKTNYCNLSGSILSNPTLSNIAIPFVETRFTKNSNNNNQKTFHSASSPTLLSVIAENIYEDPNDIVLPSFKNNTTDVENHVVTGHFRFDDIRGILNNDNNIQMTIKNDEEPCVKGEGISKIQGDSDIQEPDVMYTNKQNLLHTILLQQKLFEQAHKTTDCASQRNKSNTYPPGNNDNLIIESNRIRFKIKRKSDGSRYFIRSDTIDSRVLSTDYTYPKMKTCKSPCHLDEKLHRKAHSLNKKSILTVLTV